MSERLTRFQAPQPDPDKANVNLAIKVIMNEVETAARQQPMDACHPYVADERRARVMGAIWELYRQLKPKPKKEAPHDDAR